MQTLNEDELKLYASYLSQELEGAELQKLRGDEGSIEIQFWCPGLRSLVVDMKSNTPILGYLKKPSETFKGLNRPRALKKPLFIFLKAHFLGRAIKRVEVSSDFGRVLYIYFDEETYIEIRLFMGGSNIGAHAGGKSVYLKKPQELKKQETDYKAEEVRAPSVIEEQAEAYFLNKMKDSEASQSSGKKSQKKKANALDKINQALSDLENDLVLKFVDHLEKGQELSEDLKAFYKPKRSLRENIEWGYEEHKKKEAKKERLLARKKEIMKEGIDVPSSSGDNNGSQASSSIAKKKGLTTPVFQLKPGVLLRCGRSSKENLKLLRAAKPWFLWMHLRDYPSGHLVIERPKNSKLSGKELSQAASYLFLKGAPKKLISSPEVEFEVILTDCRYVRPIKGQVGKVKLDKFQTQIFHWKKEWATFFA